MNTKLPISQHPDNPHYFLFRGQPTILITSAEHYGAVINMDFDYIPYLDALHAKDLNYTRIYTGAYLEKDGDYMPNNTLGPRSGRQIVPWARSSVPGYALGGNKYDLDQWDPAYFARLRDFIFQAGMRDIIVEICLFNGQYIERWPYSPLYHLNNIQGVGTCDYKQVQSLVDQALVARQDDYIRKIIQEVNDFDNVILEVVDEPSVRDTPPADYRPWVEHLLDVISSTESNLPNKHLIAQMQESKKDSLGDFADHPQVTLVVAQYVYISYSQGAMQALDYEYEHNKPIEYNETAYYPIWYKGDKIASSRVEGWEFIVGGGAGFNHLNGLFTILDPAGKTSENEKILTGLQNLKNFMYSFEFVRMHQDVNFIKGGMPAGAYARGSSEPGKQYAFYIHHSDGGEKSTNPEDSTKYIVKPGTCQENLQLDIAAGSYQAEWIDPASGKMVHTEQFTHNGGIRSFTTPVYSIDIALRIESKAKI